MNGPQNICSQNWQMQQCVSKIMDIDMFTISLPDLFNWL